MWLGWVVLTTNCGAPGPRVQGPGQDNAPIPPSTTRSQSPPSRPAEAPACPIAAARVRLRVDEGQGMPTGTGLMVTHEGTSHDNFGPDGFDFVLTLHFRREGEEARHEHSFRDRSPHTVLGHCYRIVDAAQGAVLLEVSSLPATASTNPAGLEGVGAPPPNAPRCTRVRKGGPGSDGPEEIHGCAPNEICLCEAQAGYSCQGRCVPASSGYPERSPHDPLQ